MRKAKVATTTTTHDINSLGLHAWWDIVGTEKVQEVCKQAGILFSYFKMMAYYTKSCTPTTFEKIEAAAKIITPEVLPDYETCTRQSVRIAAKAARLIAKNAPRIAEQQAAAERAAQKQKQSLPTPHQSA
ncbi:hypothetical protein [Collimonas humicola]|uniref:hypothetical protein n=1 Tax=Collimonas humicola TaxID=2825886 RepID=UPI001B8CF086|nr:hypothetical protein [Collimonas humicola]